MRDLKESTNANELQSELKKLTVFVDGPHIAAMVGKSWVAFVLAVNGAGKPSQSDPAQRQLVEVGRHGRSGEWRWEKTRRCPGIAAHQRGTSL